MGKRIYDEVMNLVWPVRPACLSSHAKALLVFMVKHRLKYIAWYPGPPGTEGKGAFYWRQRPKGVPMPPLDGRMVNGLVKRGLLVYEEDNDYALTDLGRRVGENKRAEHDYKEEKKYWKEIRPGSRNPFRWRDGDEN